MCVRLRDDRHNPFGSMHCARYPADLGRRLRLWLIRGRERLLGRNSMALLNRLLAQPELNADAVARMVEDRKYAAALYAFTQSPYYRRRLSRSGVDATSLRRREGWASIPLLEKQEIRENLQELYAEGFYWQVYTRAYFGQHRIAFGVRV